MTAPASAHTLLARWRAALYAGQAGPARREIQRIASQAIFRLGHPFTDTHGGGAFFDTALAPLFYAVPDLERRDYIVVAGHEEDHGQDHGEDHDCWVGCAGQYMGTFLRPWLDIPPTGHLVQMRFHEFYRFRQDRIVEMQAVWDIPEVMMQAGAWPLAPSLGREWAVPAPASQDGINPEGTETQAAENRQRVVDMLVAMKNHPMQGPETMRMEHYWHPHLNWYGPAGIGSARGIAGFRHWHQIPFLNAMPDRGQYLKDVRFHFFAQGPYVAVTGWPDMKQTLSCGGWLGIAPSGKQITMRSLDFWRLEAGKIRENWVMVDLLDMYAQIGVDVFSRLREFNKARSMAPLHLALDYTPFEEAS